MQIFGILKYPCVFLVGFVVSFLLTPLIGRICEFYGVVDSPGIRRIHTRPVPRCGGVAVLAGFHAACAAIFLLPWPVHVNGMLDLGWWKIFLTFSTLLASVGLVDDIFNLRPAAKLFAQIAIACAMFWLDVRVGRVLWINLPAWLDLAATVFWFLLLTNAFNLIDGLDGLAAGLAIIAATGMFGSYIFRHQPGDALVLLAFIGACGGFLRYNFYPATIFLGDSGSLVLGFTLAAVALSTGAKGTTAASIGVPLIAVGVPIFDTALAVWRRSVRKIRPSPDSDSGIMHFDLEHIHHRLMAGGLTQRNVAFLMYSANIVLVSVALLSLLYSSHLVGIFLLAFVAGSYVVVRHVAHVELWDSGSAILYGLRIPSRGALWVMLYPIIDFLLLGASLTTAIFVSRYPLNLSELKDFWLVAVPLWCAPCFISLFLAGAYIRVWSRARISEFVLVALALVGGLLVAEALSMFFLPASYQIQRTEACLFGLFCVAAITGIRAMPRAIADLMLFFASTTATRSPAAPAGNRSKKVLVYGADTRCLLYLRSLDSLLSEPSGPVQVIGLVDDDPNLRKRFVHGYWVLGTQHDLPTILATNIVDTIILTTELDKASLERLLYYAVCFRIAVVEWLPRERELYNPAGGQNISVEKFRVVRG